MAARLGICTACLCWLLLGICRGGPNERVGRPSGGPEGARDGAVWVSDQPPTAPPPETLEQAWSLAVAASERLSAQRRNLSAAEEAVQAAQAQWMPSLGVESSYAVRSAEPSFRVETFGLPLPSPVIFPFQQAESFAGRATVDLPLYTSGRIAHAVAAGCADVKAAVGLVEGTAMDLKMRLAEEYVGVLRAQREVEVMQSAGRSLESHLRDVELRSQQGLVPRNDLLAAQVAVANARQRVIQAQNRLDARRAAYNRYLGRPLTTAVSVAELPIQKVAGDLETLTGLALRARPEVGALSAQAESLRHRAESLGARKGPQVSVRGEYVFEENRFRSPEGIAAAGVGVSWNVLDFGRARHEAAAVRERAESVLRDRGDLQAAIALEVRRAWLDVNETRQRLEITPQAIGQAEENLRVARQRYNQGLAINTEVLDAERLLTEAYQNHDNARYDAVLAVLRLRYATGQLQ